jgi:hypothetical protein
LAGSSARAMLSAMGERIAFMPHTNRIELGAACPAPGDGVAAGADGALNDALTHANAARRSA